MTNCKEATAISAVPWCFTEYNNKRRACTQEAGAVRPFTWFLKDNQVCHPDPSNVPYQLTYTTNKGHAWQQYKSMAILQQVEDMLSNAHQCQ